MRPHLTFASHRSSSRKWFALIVCGAILLISLPCLAQSTSAGTGVGQGTDQSGAPLPGATVSLVDRTTNSTKTVASNDSGRYVFVNVNPGIYDILISKAGFAQAKFSSQDVSIGRQLTVNATLKIGGANEQVMVEASGANLQ